MCDDRDPEVAARVLLHHRRAWDAICVGGRAQPPGLPRHDQGTVASAWISDGAKRTHTTLRNR